MLRMNLVPYLFYSIPKCIKSSLDPVKLVEFDLNLWEFNTHPR